MDFLWNGFSMKWIFYEMEFYEMDFLWNGFSMKLIFYGINFLWNGFSMEELKKFFLIFFMSRLYLFIGVKVFFLSFIYKIKWNLLWWCIITSLKVKFKYNAKNRSCLSFQKYLKPVAPIFQHIFKFKSIEKNQK